MQTDSSATWIPLATVAIAVITAGFVATGILGYPCNLEDDPFPSTDLKAIGEDIVETNAAAVDEGVYSVCPTTDDSPDASVTLDPELLEGTTVATGDDDQPNGTSSPISRSGDESTQNSSSGSNGSKSASIGSTPWEGWNEGGPNETGSSSDDGDGSHDDDATIGSPGFGIGVAVLACCLLVVFTRVRV